MNLGIRCFQNLIPTQRVNITTTTKFLLIIRKGSLMASILATLKEAFTDRNIAAVSISRVIIIIGQTLLYQWWSLYVLELGATEVIIGVLAAAQSAVMLGIQLPSGILCDRIGRKKVLVYGSLARVVSAIVLIFSSTWQQFFIGLIVNRIGSGMVITSSYILVVESLSSEKRGIAIGAQQLLTIPQMFMPFITGIYVDLLGVVLAMRTSFYLFLITTIIGLMIRVKFIRETLKVETNHTKTESKGFKKGFSRLGFFKVSKSVKIMMAVTAISAASISMAGPFLVIYAVNVIKLTSTQWGALTTVAWIIGTIFSLPAGMLSDRLGRRPIVFTAKFILPLQNLGLLLLRDFNQLLFLHVVIGVGAMGDFHFTEIGSAPTGPAWTALLADLVPAKERGKIVGLIATVSGIVDIPSSIIGGYLWTGFGPDAVLISVLFLGLIASFTFLLVKEPKLKEQ